MSTANQLSEHITKLKSCERCPKMVRPPISGGPVISKVVLVGQAPGPREPELQRPFAWTAGKTLFRWFEESCGVPEATFRDRVYIVSVARCFPGKAKNRGDRVPDAEEIAACATWMEAEFRLLQPELVICVGKLAIFQFIQFKRLTEVIGSQFSCKKWNIPFEMIPLPHPSGASTWPRTEPGKALTMKALHTINSHPAWKNLTAT